MITIIYHTSVEAKQQELNWLRDQRIFPSVENYYDFIKDKDFVRYGVIVSPEQALSIKLRHNLDAQKDYFK